MLIPDFTPFRGLVKPPGRPVGINWAHPAAGSLFSAILFDGPVPIDSMSRYRFSPIGSSAGAGVGSNGQFQQFNNTSAGPNFAWWGPNPPVTLPAAFTSICVGMRDQTTVSSGNIAYFFTTESNADRNGGCSVGLGNTFDGAGQDRVHNEVYSPAAVLGMWVNGVKQAAPDVSNAAIANNVWVAFGSTFSGATMPTGGLTLGGLFADDTHASVQYGLHGGIALELFYGGTLNDQIIASLTLDPYAAFIWPDDVMRALMMPPQVAAAVQFQPFVTMVAA